MDPGDMQPVTHGRCTDLTIVDLGSFDVAEYGSAYVLDAERPAIVETGTGTNVDRIHDALDAVGLEPRDIEFIVITHVHLDHAGGAGYLVEACENATVIVSERGAPHLIDPERLIAGTKAALGDQWKHYADPRPIPESRIRAIGPGDEIDLGDRRLIAHPAPGHARHQLVFDVPAMDAVFTGDAAGLWNADHEVVLPSTPPPEFDLDQALADVERIAALERSTLLYTHFGPADASTGVLDRYAQALADWVDLVAETRKAAGSEAETIDRLTDETGYHEVWGEERGLTEVKLNVRGALAYLDRVGQ